MKNNPLVSIIIPVYNGENYMRDAINSALAQDYDNLEVIVVNDGSKDNTDEVAKEYGDRIRYFKKENGGVSSALNLGIEKMRGEYFSWLSHDDMYFKNKVSSEIEFLKSNNLLKKKVIAYSDFCLVNPEGKLIVNVEANHATATSKPEYALLRGLINGNCLLIPKDAFKTYGGFDTKLKCVQDYQKWYEMQQTYTFVHVPEITVKSRFHPKQVSNTSPLVRTEGNEFWTRMIKETDDLTKVRLNGNLYSFYYNMSEYLKASPYDEALEYCNKQLAKLEKEKVEIDLYRKNNNNGDVYSKNYIVRFFQLIKNVGLKTTSKRIIKKLSK